MGHIDIKKKEIKNEVKGLENVLVKVLVKQDTEILTANLSEFW